MQNSTARPRRLSTHATTVVNFDPMTLAIIFPLLTTDISPNLINALIQCLTTPLSLQTPDQTNTCCGNAPRLMQHVRYFSAAAPAHARGVRRRIAPRRVVWTPSAYITRFRWRFYRFDGGLDAPSASQRRTVSAPYTRLLITDIDAIIAFARLGTLTITPYITPVSDAHHARRQ